MPDQAQVSHSKKRKRRVALVAGISSSLIARHNINVDLLLPLLDAPQDMEEDEDARGLRIAGELAREILRDEDEEI